MTRLTSQAPAEDIDAVGEDLLSRWSEPHRRYHTTTHLTEMFTALGEIEEAGETGTRAGALGRVAAWFHDAVYVVPDPGDNEERSAGLAEEALARLGLEAADIETVTLLVRASERHRLPSSGGLDAAFHDADLWVLAAGPTRFDDYCSQVREEYRVVPREAYAAGRSAVLQPFLDRPHLYATRLGRSAWEARARNNLAREIARLGRPVSP